MITLTIFKLLFYTKAMQLIASVNHVLNFKIAFIIFHVHILKRLINTNKYIL